MCTSHSMKKKFSSNTFITLIIYSNVFFQATLTLMGDSPKIPWRLLDITLLVEDPETGGVYPSLLQGECLLPHTSGLIAVTNIRLYLFP